MFLAHSCLYCLYDTFAERQYVTSLLVDNKASYILELFSKTLYTIRTFSNGVALVASKSWFGLTVVMVVVVIFYVCVLNRNIPQIGFENAPAEFNDNKNGEKFDTAYLPAVSSPEFFEDVNGDDTGYDSSQDAARAATNYLRVVKMCLLLGSDGTDLVGCLEKPDFSSMNDDEWITILNEWIRMRYCEVEKRCVENQTCLQGFQITD
ncbi:MAG: hypothetical protein UW63_C0094G0002 [Candidatus Uhrbacteria bacterium GW2011_GWF2_44_350]|uniref:Uncharacterized protein n=1 Tax=Candidatus Uhrbacteria bacterium GW2011_GWF2_44_350 TaxID=1619000 RepID=A0A0G1J8B6_9BACT|nr:MAG: hypothetical protein UW63_C0094G0002 [Candidatus Uhrbacteria bacterium GW2011_GWF2_44_350]